MEPRSFDEKQTLAEDVAVHLSKMDVGLNEGRVKKIETGRRNASVGDDDLT